MEELKATTKSKPISHSLMGNLSMFSPELLYPQATPSSPLHIPLSFPIGSPAAVPLRLP
ncbi:uncharacterized protein BJ212DRAFT_1355226 [Suillus subaureus]|uniref:Uncharacterized protein n=1 Tax=Suillus subaureus TaxID=48587 RepID=A0A9P7EBI0_9AGAM|nr:uncharacterized protein BJ212DRAFT_1408358 [Suillus subaureus]XP_041193199.1 uncharacterized protein BJ212DRAFT_1355226 [Suillus subaureus]KAG1796493.1 hypothetical protein BJ212DRAFT_1408358 [Suillus subaureus]KAG1816526.1 hypothetical protein BJ212DRAFT_1355226 [Suillus subaureus]